ncbi:MAG: hypothetical protein DRP66_11655 [Planctomycetota bacterium]|nr:MAG: hypothetical protein DRP66_11655 [Planctomycetota bacterium]
MAVKFECPRCGKHLSASSDYAGKEGKCKCGAALIVPGDSDRMKFKCTRCGGGISVRKMHAGKKGKCPTCANAVRVPLLGTLLGEHGRAGGAKPTAAAAPAATISFACPMCDGNVEARKSSAGNIMECPACGSFVEVPGEHGTPSDADIATVGIGPGIADMEAGGEALVGRSKIICPSCLRKLPDGAPVCARCGIYIKNGRPILTAWDVNPDELEDKAHRVVKAVSWLIPFGVYPVYSEAMGTHKPYATWGMVAVTVLVSIWFLALEISGSAQMRSAKNLMLWGGDAKPHPQRIQMLYEYSNYGDAEAFYAKREALSGTTPKAELDVAALNALTPEQRCFGEYRYVQLITHAFLHGGILHLAGNMLFFLVFGSRVNAAIGNILMVIMYPILAIAAALTYLAMLGARPPTAMLGASGAVMGLAGAYLLLYPVHKIYMAIWMRWGLLLGFRLSFKCFAVRGFWVVLFYIMFDVIAVSLGQNTGTAHWAHIGGLIWGFIIAYGLLAGRIAYSGSDVVSLVLGRHAWRIIGTPHSRRQ